jgi:RNA polymerase sigma-70 factor (ECF subfamily)
MHAARLGRRAYWLRKMPSDAIVSRVNSLFDHWYGSLVRYAAGLTGQIDVAEDIVQEAFYQLYRQLAAGKVIDSDRAWTFSVVRRHVTRHFSRASLREISFTSPELLENYVSVFSAANQRGEDLARHFSILTRREEEVVRLCMDSLKYREIAAALEISPNSVATLHRRAIRKLRGLLCEKRSEKIQDVVVTP